MALKESPLAINAHFRQPPALSASTFHMTIALQPVTAKHSSHLYVTENLFFFLFPNKYRLIARQRTQVEAEIGIPCCTEGRSVFARV